MKLGQPIQNLIDPEAECLYTINGIWFEVSLTPCKLVSRSPKTKLYWPCSKVISDQKLFPPDGI